MRRLLIAALGGLAMAVLPACHRQPATPEAASRSDVPREGAKAPVTPGAQGTPAEAWKLEYGPSDAKVVIECFYPMEGHEWVAELNKKILANYPNQVRILHINWQTDSGLRELEAKKLEPCGQYLIDGQIVVKKNQTLGNWKDEDLLNAVKKAVQAKYGNAAVRTAADVTVFVPCGLAGPFGDLRQQFAKERPDVKLTCPCRQHPRAARPDCQRRAGRRVPLHGRTRAGTAEDKTEHSAGLRQDNRRNQPVAHHPSQQPGRDQGTQRPRRS